MSRQSSTQLNELLVRLFNHVMTAEGKAIITEKFKDISNNDMHIIEAVGIQEPKSVSTIARSLGVTVGTLTVNMNNLEKKGYLSRTRSKEDRRVVLVELTEKGLVIAGTLPDDSLVEMIEVKDHPWFVATQAHPELKSRPNNPHPLFRDFVKAALAVGQTK